MNIEVFGLNIPLVNVAEEPFGLAVNNIYYKKGWTDDPVIWLREGFAHALVKAQKRLNELYVQEFSLPLGHEPVELVIFAGYRTLATQLEVINYVRQRLQHIHKHKPQSFIEKEVAKYTSAPDNNFGFWNHRAAGAVDCWFRKKIGKWMLPMGVPFDEPVPEAGLFFYDDLPTPTALQQRIATYRKIFHRAMVSAEIGKYLPEAWHRDFLLDAKDFGFEGPYPPWFTKRPRMQNAE